MSDSLRINESENESHSIVSDSLWPHGLYSWWTSPGQNTAVARLSVCQRIFSTQGWNLALPHCRHILYQLSHKGRPRILEWVTYPFSCGFSQPRNPTDVSCIAGGFFTNWSIREALRNPRTYSNSGPLIRWCHPKISSSAAPFFSCSYYFPASGSFPMSWLFATGGPSIGVSASASVLPVNIQGWFPLGLTGLISLLSKGLSKIFSNTTVQKHQFFVTQCSWWSNSHTGTWLLEKP